MGIWGFGFGFVSFVSRKVSVSPRTLAQTPLRACKLCAYILIQVEKTCRTPPGPQSVDGGHPAAVKGV